MKVLLRSRSLAAGGLLVLALAALLPATASAKPEPGYRPKGFRLFARVLGGITINRVALGLSATRGNVGTDSTGSATTGGGYWPKGTANQFVFNSGLQVAGIVSNPGGVWDGDTTAAYFFNARGGGNGDAVEPIYNFANPSDAAAWPVAAKVPLENNPSDNFYDPSLAGLNSASQGDVWFITWDGNPTLNSDRPHPLGIAVESRGLGWNFGPPGNEDIVYFIFTFYNISASNPAIYSGVRPAIRPIVEKMGVDFKAANEKTFGVSLPADGYAINSAYSGFGADMDVGAATNNYCSVNIPFALGFCWVNSFTPAQGEQYANPLIWGAPFFAGPGFVGVKYLRSPTGPGAIQLFSNTANSSATAPSPFPDPQGSSQLYRYLSGNFSTALDRPCNVAGGRPNPPAGICYISVSAQDARFYQSSTELTLAPGELKSIVVAYIFAAPVAVPNFTADANTDVKPGNPVRLIDPTLLTNGANLIDSIAGYNGFVSDGDGVVNQNEIQTIPSSLLAKALTAQAVFDNGFLLPFSPEAPNFYLIPGNNQVSVVWQPSASEYSGDPFYSVASNPGTPTSPNSLYDPNYRQFDVEGYRIYRGRVNNAAELTLVAQFDYAGTEMKDFTGQIQPTSECRPELGVIITCPGTVGTPEPPPGTSGYTFVAGSGLAPSPDSYVPQPLVGQFVQVPLGGPFSVVLANGTALIVPNSADSALTSAKNGGYPELSDNGVPFAYIDNEPKNNFRYFYAVTAFDVNSIQSGPSSLESARSGKAVTPSVTATNTVEATLTAGLYGEGGTQLDVDAPFTIDPTTGRFSGTPPATNGVGTAFAPLIPALLPALNLTATIDSVRALTAFLPPDDVDPRPECGGQGNSYEMCYIFYVTFDSQGQLTHFQVPTSWPVSTNACCGDPTTQLEAQLGAQAVPIDPANAAIYGIPATATGNAAVSVTMRQYIQFSSMEGQAARRNFPLDNTVDQCPGSTVTSCQSAASPGGSRWFSGSNETVDHPGYGIRVGHLDGVDSVWAPISHVAANPGSPPVISDNNAVTQRFAEAFAGLGREADVQLTWGANGAVESIRDLTHDVKVPWSPEAAASYGFVTDASGDGKIGWDDFFYIQNVCEFYINTIGGGPPGCDDLSQIKPLVATAALTAVTTSYSVPGATTGQGFGLYINGEPYIFQLAALPAAGTKWTLRTYSGIVRSTVASAGTLTPEGYSFAPTIRSPGIPGLKIRFTVTKTTSTVAVTNLDLTKVHTVPDPYYVTNGYEATTENKVLQFVNLPAQAIIRIYTSSGILVNLLEHNSQNFSGAESWNLRNRNNQVVASGVYFYMIEAGDARRVGRFTVVNFAQ